MWWENETGKKWLCTVLWLGLLMLVLTGCAALKRPEEIAWQALRAYDTAATLNTVGDPCYKEGHPITKAVIGSEPSRGEVLAWGLGGAVIHAGVSDFLIQRDMTRTYKIWQAVTFIDTAMAIRDGISIGVRVGAPNTKTVANNCGAPYGS